MLAEINKDAIELAATLVNSQNKLIEELVITKFLSDLSFFTRVSRGFRCFYG
jgi:hypothetical protein